MSFLVSNMPILIYASNNSNIIIYMLLTTKRGILTPVIVCQICEMFTKDMTPLVLVQ